MYTVLSGLEAHTDRNEGNFGQFSQQLRREPNARLQTINSKLVMRANQTVQQSMQNEKLLSCVAKTIKLEHLESSFTIKKQLSALSTANEPHLQQLRETMSKRQQNRIQKADLVTTQITVDGEIVSSSDIDRIVSAYSSERKVLLKVLKLHINYSKNKYPDIAHAHKNLFLFSHEKQILKCTEIQSNLMKIIRFIHGESVNCSFPQMPAPVRPECFTVSDCPSDDSQSETESEESDTDEPEINVSELQMDACVVVGFVDRWYPGYITDVVDEDSRIVNFLHPAKESNLNCNIFQWPSKQDKVCISHKAMLMDNVELMPQGNSLRMWMMSSPDLKLCNKRYNK